MSPRSPDTETSTDALPIRLCIFAVGFSAVVVQLILMREMLAAFVGNEVMFAVLLGNWFLATGLGAWLGRHYTRRSATAALLPAALAFIGLCPIAQVFALRLLRDVLFLRGAVPGPAEAIVSSFLLLLPYCGVSGYLLAWTAALLSQRCGPRAAGIVYLADAVGSIAGGAIFTFLLAGNFDHFVSLAFAGGIVLVASCAVVVRMHRRVASVALALLGAGVVAALTLNLDARSTRKQFPEQHILFRGNSHYGRVIVAESAGQLNFLQNGIPIASTSNTEYAEETVHLAAAQRVPLKRVLLISGGLSGALDEILKYPVEQVVCVELDPLIIEAGKRFSRTALGDSRVRLVSGDARAFVRRTDERFDVVLMDLPEPSTTQLNRFFTLQFFRKIRRVLQPGGVLSTPMGAYGGSVSRDQAHALSSIRRTLETSFRHVLVLPGLRLFVLASDEPLTAQVSSRMEAARIHSQFVTRDYEKAMFTPDHLAEAERSSREEAAMNSDFVPALYQYYLRRWISEHQFRFLVPALVATALVLVFALRLRPPALAVFTSGFAAAALEFVLLLNVQTLSGAAYHQVGLIVTGFMAGLAVGACSANRRVASPTASARRLFALAAALAVLSLLLLPCMHGLERLSGVAFGQILVPTAITTVAFLLGTLVGAVFPVANHADPGDHAVASRLYTADFVGSAAGALLAGTLLIPLTGIAGTCLIAGGLNVAAAVAIFVRPARQAG